MGGESTTGQNFMTTLSLSLFRTKQNKNKESQKPQISQLCRVTSEVQQQLLLREGAKEKEKGSKNVNNACARNRIKCVVKALQLYAIVP